MLSVSTLFCRTADHYNTTISSQCFGSDLHNSGDLTRSTDGNYGIIFYIILHSKHNIKLVIYSCIVSYISYFHYRYKHFFFYDHTLVTP